MMISYYHDYHAESNALSISSLGSLTSFFLRKNILRVVTDNVVDALVFQFTVKLNPFVRPHFDSQQ